MPLSLDAAKVTKTYGRGEAAVTALNSLDVSVEEGEFVAIMGASGSGKSTLLHVLAGLTGIDAGSITIGGSDIMAMNESARTRFRRQHMGIVFQSFNLVPVLSAIENVALPLTLDGVSVPEAHKKAEGLLAEVGLSGRALHKPDQLSGGEQQRVALARGLVNDPTLVLADEPTGNLDSRSQETVCKLLKKLHEQHQRSLVVVTHEIEVACWAQRVVILRDGQVAADLKGEAIASAESLGRHYREASPEMVTGEKAGV